MGFTCGGTTQISKNFENKLLRELFSPKQTLTNCGNTIGL
jgi:hypothetical protein